MTVGSWLLTLLRAAGRTRSKKPRTIAVNKADSDKERIRPIQNSLVHSHATRKLTAHTPERGKY